MPRGSIPTVWDGMAHGPPDWLHSHAGGSVCVPERERLGAGRRGLHRDCSGVVDTRRTTPRQGSPQNVAAFAQKDASCRSRAISVSIRSSPTSISCPLAARLSPKRNGSSSSTPKRPWSSFVASGWSWIATRCSNFFEFWQTHQQEAAGDHAAGSAEDWRGGRGRPGMGPRPELCRRCCPGSMTRTRLLPLKIHAPCRGTLRDYQRRGVAWLQYLESLGLNPCLADDMGLGKTLEVIACLLKEREEAADLPPTLVIAPTSVLGNWRKEIERFAPQLRALVHQGSARLKDKQAFAETCQRARCCLDFVRPGPPGRKALAGPAMASRGGRRGPEHQESPGCPDARDSQARLRRIGWL